MSSPKHKLPISPKALLLLLAGLLFLFVMLPQFGDFQSSLDAIRHADRSYLVLAGLGTVTTFFAATGVFVLLALRKLRFLPSLLVQIACSFTNRLLPAGAGNIATLITYFKHNKHTNSQAVAVASVNNLLGFIGLLCIVMIATFLSNTPITEVINIHIPRFALYVIVGLFLSACLVVVAAPKLKRAVVDAVGSVGHNVRRLSKRPARLLLAWFCSMLLTLCYGATLYWCILAFGQDVSILQSLIVLAISVLAATATPTPGGIGGAEAGLVAGLASVGVPTTTGLPIAMTYRLLTFWIPILPGFVAFQISLKKDYL